MFANVIHRKQWYLFEKNMDQQEENRYTRNSSTRMMMHTKQINRNDNTQNSSVRIIIHTNSLLGIVIHKTVIRIIMPTYSLIGMIIEKQIIQMNEKSNRIDF